MGRWKGRPITLYTRSIVFSAKETRLCAYDEKPDMWSTLICITTSAYSLTNTHEMFIVFENIFPSPFCSSASRKEIRRRLQRRRGRPEHPVQVNGCGSKIKPTPPSPFQHLSIRSTELRNVWRYKVLVKHKYVHYYCWKKYILKSHHLWVLFLILRDPWLYCTAHTITIENLSATTAKAMESKWGNEAVCAELQRESYNLVRSWVSWDINVH